MSTEPPITFGDNVRIRTTPETEAMGLAGRVGNVSGVTTPSVNRVQVVGEPHDDRALHVYVQALGRGAWFASHLLEFIDHGAGTTITLDGVAKQWVRESAGDWVESQRSLGPREWFPWLRNLLRRLGC